MMSLIPATRAAATAPPLSSEDIERALLSGAHARTLETYFGEQEYAELITLAGRAASRSRRGGPRVLLLPGICGSMLARMNGDKAHTLWVNFWDILLGHLGELVLPDVGKTIRATEAHPGTYLKMKLWLRGEGFDTDDHPFDWRQSIPDLGKELANRVNDEAKTREVHLVAHSMGGLVARAAIGQGMKDFKRLIMLGTPNYGSFAPVMVFRGIYRFLKLIALLDLPHSAKTLAGTVFNTFPGLTQMMPQRAKFTGIDLYNINAWPKTGPRPLEALLKNTPKAQEKFAIPAPDKMTMIAGVDQQTVVGARVVGDEFVFDQTNDGDGTVPRDFAVIANRDTYFVREGHGELPKNAKVWQAVKELIYGNPASQLEREWSPSRAAPTSISEKDFEAMQTPRRGPAELRPADLRKFMQEFAAGPEPAVTTPAGIVAATASEESEAPFHSVVIGRRGQRRVEIKLAHGSITQVKSRAYVLGLFEDVQPAGATLAIDAQLNGAITEFSHRRMFSSAVGEIFMMPAGRNELRADYVLFTGLGTFDRFNVDVLETVAENLARTLVRTDIEEFATVLIGGGTGIPTELGLRKMLQGFLRGLRDADPNQDFRGVTLCELDDKRYEELKWSLYHLSSTPLFDDIEVTLNEIQLAAPPAPVRAVTGGLGSIPSVYLTVRTEKTSASKWRFCSSLLTSGAKATVIAGEIDLVSSEINKHLEKIEKDSFNYAALPEFGATLAKLVLPPEIIAALEGSTQSHVVVIHDDDASRIPWETLYIAKRFPALDEGMSRRYLAANMSVAKWLEQRRQEPTLSLLLVANPTEDLAGAAEEGERIETLWGKNAGVRLKKIFGAAATRAVLLEEIQSGKYDVLHYAGHAFFDAARPARSGLLCSDGPLTGADLAGLNQLPTLVFFNACESARVRSAVRKTRYTSVNLRDRIERSVGVAEAFLRGGVANFIGTYWPVGDASALAFSEQFYQSLLDKTTFAEAMQKSRQAVNSKKSVDWADYIQYGNVDFPLKYSPVV